ncbi:protein kinase [Nonomuraea sp. NBC_01738]|uniref:serine/threonine-protein kinase n=1 Tax=Nonomuraea sp. NBC_01738 TaxID=2976003 RepID=UPI002E150745|nr:protein kinase [Nonomuraea sp. NBC_01738]
MPEVVALLAEDPASVGPYRLEGRLGVGGQGTVYVGRGADEALVAVKLLHPHLMADDRERQRFLREVETAKRVAPFCTAQVLDLGFVGGRPYIVSEYVDGPSLQDAVRDNGPRGTAALHRLAVNTATALAAIHEAGVVHRDFKPGNVLLGPDGPVVIDFGIARALGLSQSIVSSQPIGSPAYMAPEQIAGGDVGAATDLFAWAATMVYAATGRRAFVSDSIPAILHTILQGEPDLGGIDGPLRELLLECLAKDPARRPTAAQVLVRLRALTTTAPVLPPPPPSLPSAPPPRRRRGLLMGTAGAALLVAAVTGYFTMAPSTSGYRATGAAVSSSPPPQPSLTPSTAPPTPGATKRRQSAKAIPTHSAPSPHKTPAPTRTAKTSAPVEPDPEPTKKPTSKPTRSTPPPSDDPPPAPAQETITLQDAHEYCKAQGQSMAGGTWSNLWCLGGSAITATTVCQWKYQGREAVAEQPASAMAQEVTCRLT